MNYGEITERRFETRMDTVLFVQSIMGATERRRDGWTEAGAMPGMAEVVLMLKGLVAC